MPPNFEYVSPPMRTLSPGASGIEHDVAQCQMSVPDPSGILNRAILASPYVLPEMTTSSEDMPEIVNVIVTVIGERSAGMLQLVELLQPATDQLVISACADGVAVSKTSVS